MISKVPDEPAPEESQGGMGGLFADTQQQAGGVRHLRSDARLAKRILSLGVVPEEKIASLLRKGAKLASRCAGKGDARGYGAVMGVFVAAAKLELQTAEYQQPAPEQHQHLHVVRIIEDEAWYGNTAHAKAAEAIAAHPGGAAGPGTIQGDCVWPPLEQNGHGPANGN